MLNNMNPFHVFLHPKRVVQAGYDHPNPVNGALLVLLPSVLFALLIVLLGLSLRIDYVFELAKTILRWIVAGIALYLALLVFKGGEAKGKFLGVLYNLSLLRLFILVNFGLLLVVGFVVTPDLFYTVQELNAQQSVSMDEAFAALDQVEVADGVIPLVLSLAFMLATAAFFVLMVYVLYQVVALAGEASTFKNVLVLFVALLINFGVTTLI